MLSYLWYLVGLAAATKQYELIAIHTDSVFAYTTIQLDLSTSRLSLSEGEAVWFEFLNGDLLAHTHHGPKNVAIDNGHLTVSSQRPTDHRWSLSDSIYLQGTYWVCGNNQAIATGDVNAPKSCLDPSSVMIYAAPVQA